MRYFHEAIDAINELRAKLAALIGEAAAAQEFDDVARIAELAASVKAGLASNGKTREVERAGETPALHVPESASLDDGGVARALRQRGGNSDRDYPRFERENDRLVKIGWSKRDRRSYEHRAPREVVATVTSEIAKAGKGGRVFSVEDVIPVKTEAGNDVPTYQVYLALGLLRNVGAVERRGKEGYAVNQSRIDGAEFERLWESLPEHH